MSTPTPTHEVDRHCGEPYNNRGVVGEWESFGNKSLFRLCGGGKSIRIPVAAFERQRSTGGTVIRG